MKHKVMSSIASSIILLLAVFPVKADEIGFKEARALREAGIILPLEQIIDIAKSIKPGEIIDTELEEEDGYYEYEIEMLDVRGRVWEMEFDASTGELMDLELDD